MTTPDASDLLLHVSTRTWVTVIIVAVAVAGGAAYWGYPAHRGRWWWTSRGGRVRANRPRPKSKLKGAKPTSKPTSFQNETTRGGVGVGAATATATATKKRRKTKGHPRVREDGRGDEGERMLEPGVSVPGGFDAVAGGDVALAATATATATAGGDARVQTLGVVRTATEHEGQNQNQNESKHKHKGESKSKTKGRRRKRVHERWTEDEGENEGEGEGEGGADTPTATGDPAVPAKSSIDTDSSWTHVKTSSTMVGARVPPRTTGAAAAHGAVDQADVPSSDADDTVTSSDHDSQASLDRILMALRDGVRIPLSKRRRARRLAMMRKQAREKEEEEEDRPRVIRVQPPPDETPVPGFSWEDYGDVVEDGVHAHDADAEDEGEWGVVKSRRTRQTTTTTTTTSSPSGMTLQAAPASATEHKTKKQRQNARRRELTKAAKASVEADRLQGLAEHKRELERRRIVEQSRQGGGKRPSGGMQAKVDELGKLVWE